MKVAGVHFEVYVDSGDAYRWRLVDGNNRIVATSGEAYTRKPDVWRAIRNVTDGIRDFKVPEPGEDD